MNTVDMCRAVWVYSFWYVLERKALDNITDILNHGV